MSVFQKKLHLSEIVSVFKYCNECYNIDASIKSSINGLITIVTQLKLYQVMYQLSNVAFLSDPSLICFRFALRGIASYF